VAQHQERGRRIDFRSQAGNGFLRDEMGWHGASDAPSFPVRPFACAPLLLAWCFLGRMVQEAVDTLVASPFPHSLAFSPDGRHREAACSGEVKILHLPHRE
jgi:hypothetical protein